jgi:exodeoxyribonuclease VII small subunit
MTLSYEQSLDRLEKILEMMNSGKVSLEDSLKLFEEAENLMRKCTQSLNTAEKTIEKLMKERNQLVVEGADNTPKTEPF